MKKKYGKYLKENTDGLISQNMISFCDGSLGKALKIHKQKEMYNSLEELISQIERRDLVDILNNAEVLYNQKEYIYDLLEYINVLLVKSKQIQKINCVEYVEEAKRRLLANSNYDMTIDNLLFKIWETIRVEK